ncbi:hypothetical protein N2152v2_009672 [Parachlorella kessleri]
MADMSRLPREVIQHVYGAKLPKRYGGFGETVLSLKDRALEELFLCVDRQVLLGSLAAVGSFTRLKGLELQVRTDREEQALDLAAMVSLPALKRLQCSFWGTVELRGGALLPQLTSLSFTTTEHEHRPAVAQRLLQAAPPSVSHLGVGGIERICSQPPPFAWVPHVTSLSCSSPAIIPHLGPLAQLQHLKLRWCSADGLTKKHMERLCGVSTLRRLSFAKTQGTSGTAALRRIQELVTVLPAGCIIEHPVWG